MRIRTAIWGSMLLVAATAAVAQSVVLDVYSLSTHTMHHITLPAQSGGGLGNHLRFETMPPSPRLLADPALRLKLKAMLARRPKDVDRPRELATGALQSKRAGSEIFGTYHAIVLLVDFTDHAPQWYPGMQADDHYTKMLFSVGTYPTGSMRDYYKENSYNQFEVTGEVAGGASGWYRAPQSYAYYVAGQNGFGAYPHNAQKLIEDAVRLADPDVDYSQYDNNGDGVVDSLFVVHSGPGAEATGSDNDIWSHKWSIPQVMLDGVNVSDYSIEPEDGTIGVFCHEYGHVLGAYDLYDYGNDSAGYDSAGLGVWSIMAGGSWGADYNHANRPAHFDPYHKILFGWIKPTLLAADQTAVTLPAVETTPTVYKLWQRSKATIREYFLVENRQKTGFDSLLYNSGLLIYHIDQSKFSGPVNDEEWFPGLPTSAHYAVGLEQADARWDLEHNFNVGDAGDPFPGTANQRTFNFASLPDSSSYLGGPTGISVTNISDSGATMTADIGVSLPAHTHWYVRASASVYGNGGSWDTAFATIGQAMAVARPGDIITVAPGVYTESVNFAGKEVTLTSTQPEDSDTVANTIIRAGVNGASVLFRHTEGRGAVLDGFTISHLPGITGNGVNIMGASPTIRNCVIRDNTDNRGGENLSYGGGMLVIDGANPLLTNNRFEKNAADVGAGLCIQNAGAQVVNNTFTGNRATYDGGGMALLKADPQTVVQSCVFSADQAKRGGGILCTTSSPLIADCRFSDCSARTSGGALYLRVGSNARVLRASITNCSAFLYSSSGGAGLYCVLGSNAIIDGLSLWGCSSPQGAGLYSDADSNPTVTNSIIAGCTGPGIQSQRPLTVTYSDVWGNTNRNYIGFANPTGTSGNLSVDPRFADTVNGDLHLKSRLGRWTERSYGPGTTEVVWVQDTVNSPCIDAGDPAAAVGAEPEPNGSRLNMGAEGGTDQASKSVRGTILSGTSPANGATGVVVRPSVRLHFRDAVVEKSAREHFSLTIPPATPMGPIMLVPGSVRWLQPGKIMQFTPTGALPGGTRCVATISEGVEKQDGGLTGWSESFSFTIADGSDTAATVTALALPTPNGGAQITVSLTAASQVGAEIMNLAGTAIATLAPRNLPQGVGTLLWDGKSKLGTKVPAGQYLVRVRALRSDGSTSSCIVALRR